MAQETVYYATGKRKTAVAKTWLKPGTGKVVINNRPAEEYFRLDSLMQTIGHPFQLTNNQNAFDVRVSVLGGGINGQADAIRHGITKALVQADPDLRSVLKKAGFIKRDPRAKERKKYGQRGARARFQFSKR